MDISCRWTFAMFMDTSVSTDTFSGLRTFLCVYGHFCVYGHSVSTDTSCLRTLYALGHCLSADICLRAVCAYGHCPCLRTLVSTDTLSMATYVCSLLTALHWTLQGGKFDFDFSKKN